jgi:NADH dehydrogenase FAD-containing subunit
MMKHLVLWGAGPAHMRLLARLAVRSRIPAEMVVSLVTRQRQAVDVARLLHAIARQRSLDGCATDIEPAARAAGVRLVAQKATGLDAATGHLLLDDGRTLQYDWLSVDLEPQQPRELVEAQLPGARANGLLAGFGRVSKHWPTSGRSALQS